MILEGYPRPIRLVWCGRYWARGSGVRDRDCIGPGDHHDDDCDDHDEDADDKNQEGGAGGIGWILWKYFVILLLEAAKEDIVRALPTGLASWTEAERRKDGFFTLREAGRCRCASWSLLSTSSSLSFFVIIKIIIMIIIMIIILEYLKDVLCWEPLGKGAGCKGGRCRD